MWAVVGVGYALFPYTGHILLVQKWLFGSLNVEQRFEEAKLATWPLEDEQKEGKGIQAFSP